MKILIYFLILILTINIAYAVSWTKENNDVIVNLEDSNIKTWILDINVPSGVSITDYAFSGGSGIKTLSFCHQDNSILGCIAIADDNIDNQLVLKVSGTGQLTGSYTIITKDNIESSGSLSSLNIDIANGEEFDWDKYLPYIIGGIGILVFLVLKKK